VPTDALRNGDFSSAAVPLYDPQTGQPFAGNIIPVERMNPASSQLLQYYRAPNPVGRHAQLSLFDTSCHTRHTRFNARIQHNFSGSRPGGGGGRGGTGGGEHQHPQQRAGQAGKGRRLLGTRTNVNMNLKRVVPAVRIAIN
jgi:hypothetical protein